MDWKTFYQNTAPPDIVRLISKPDRWQFEFADYLRQRVPSGEVLEAGCGSGVTSLLIGATVHRTLLDLDAHAVQTAEQVFSATGQQARCMQGDLFAMPFPDGSFDCVFNAGVLEHFDQAMRAQALREMARVTRSGGLVVVAVPNHCSYHYHSAYCWMKAHGRWPYPDEEVIRDFQQELTDIPTLRHLDRRTIDISTAEWYARRLPLLARIKLRRAAKGQPVEGYLSVLTMEKAGA